MSSARYVVSDTVQKPFNATSDDDNEKITHSEGNFGFSQKFSPLTNAAAVNNDDDGC